MREELTRRVLSGGRLAPEEGAELLRSAPLADLGALAQEMRFRRRPAREVTFVVDTNPNYTNVCVSGCRFCPFFRRPGAEGGFTLTVAEVVERARRARDAGVTTLLLQGGLNPELKLPYYLDLVRGLREAVPGMHLHLFSAPEVRHMAAGSGRSVEEVLEALRAAGLETLPGGGAEVLSDRVRARLAGAPGGLKSTVREWTDVHRAAHRLGFKSSATMMYGHVEEPEDVVAHLEEVRRLQDETDGFTAFVPWSFKPGNTALAAEVEEYAGPAVYLRHVALARVYLDNFEHVQASWFSEGRKTGEIALNFGADDFGGTLLEENVHREAGFVNTTTVAGTIETIRAAGFTPVQRDTLYRRVRAFEGVRE